MSMAIRQCFVPIASMLQEYLGATRKKLVPSGRLQQYAKPFVSMPCCAAQDLPVGHTLCLSGKTFVVSGQLDSLTRQQARARPCLQAAVLS